MDNKERLFRARSLGRSKENQKQLRKVMDMESSEHEQKESEVSAKEVAKENYIKKERKPEKTREENKEAVKRTLDMLRKQKSE